MTTSRGWRGRCATEWCVFFVGRGSCDAADVEPGVLEALSAATVQGRRGLGPRAGAYASRLGRGTAGGGEFRRGKLCADYDGFSLHGGVRMPGYCRERLEKRSVT